jgi:glycosyltransferase involved in cell wall biosynthesis
MSVSILILTLNEEVNLPTCLETVKWCDDIVVFDSFSTDRTAVIARAAGARVLQRRFDNYGSQREAARIEINYKYPWVLALDADEVPDQELIDEMMKIAAMPDSAVNAFRMRRKDFFMGQWIKHSTLYPSWFIRFYKPDRILYEPRTVHEYPTVSGKVGELQGHLMHQSFNKGIGDWMRKHVRYAELEALESLQHSRSGQIDWKGLFAMQDPVRYRRTLKSISYRLPFRPALRFLYMYLFRLGMLDGRAGFTYCRLLAIYEYMIVLRIMELQRRENGQAV